MRLQSQTSNPTNIRSASSKQHVLVCVHISVRTHCAVWCVLCGDCSVLCKCTFTYLHAIETVYIITIIKQTGVDHVLGSLFCHLKLILSSLCKRESSMFSSSTWHLSLYRALSWICTSPIMPNFPRPCCPMQPSASEFPLLGLMKLGQSLANAMNTCSNL